MCTPLFSITLTHTHPPHFLLAVCIARLTCLSHLQSHFSLQTTTTNTTNTNTTNNNQRTSCALQRSPSGAPCLPPHTAPSLEPSLWVPRTTMWLCCHRPHQHPLPSPQPQPITCVMPAPTVMMSVQTPPVPTVRQSALLSTLASRAPPLPCVKSDGIPGEKTIVYVCVCVCVWLTPPGVIASVSVSWFVYDTVCNLPSLTPMHDFLVRTIAGLQQVEAFLISQGLLHSIFILQGTPGMCVGVWGGEE